MSSPPAAHPETRDAAGRLAADAVFPAGWPGHDARLVAVGAGEHARVVRCAASGGSYRSAPAVVCLHGWGACAYGYRHVLGPIATAGTDAYAPDLRGHGWSAKPLDRAAYAPDALATWTLGLVDALALDRVVLVGHSLGGAIALHTARLAPDRVAALVLLAPLGLDTVERLEQIRRLTPDVIDAWLPIVASVRTVTALALRTAYGRLGSPTPRDVDEYWAPTADPRFARAARLIFHADPWTAFAPDVLAGIPQPVEVVAGARDNLLRVDSLRRLTGAFPRGALDVVPDAGHVLADEVPDRVVAAVARARAAVGNA
ncbi:hypothetical protein tb265_24160 [Gemmatimonadetes bacterium T265]|nr:hypothetical protein tb265_24160 [Gemmatimonadetes bacterium T265]